MVDDLAAGTKTMQVGGRFASGFVVVEKAWITECRLRNGTALERLTTEFSTTVSLTGCMLFASDRYERKSMNPSKTMTLAWDADMALSDSQAIGSLPAWNDAIAPMRGNP